MDGGYSALELSWLAGFKTTVMLNYLERSGIFLPESERTPHHGKKRQYSFRDLVVLRSIKRLLDMGVRPKRISQAIQTFHHIEQLPDNVDSLLEFSQKSAHFVVSGDHVLYCETPQSIVDLTKGGQLEMAFILDIPGTLGGVARAAKAYKSARDIRQSAHKATVLERISKEHDL